MTTNDRLETFNNSVSEFEQFLAESNEFAYQKYGLTLLYSLEVNETSEQMKKLGIDIKEDEVYFYNKGTSAAQEGNYDVAVTNLRKALEINDEFKHARYNLALALAESGDLDKSVKELKKLQKDAASEREAREIANSIEELKLKKDVQ
jgi:tetratricopeptide (TPR) repeat protein